MAEEPARTSPTSAPAIARRIAVLKAVDHDDTVHAALLGRVKVATLIRALVATVYFVSVQLALTPAETFQHLGSTYAVRWLTIGVYLYSVVLVVAWLLGRQAGASRWLLPAQTLLDTAAITAYALFTGFSGSFFTVFYFVLIFFNATGASRRWFFATVGVTALAYVSLVVIEVVLAPLSGLFTTSVVPLSFKAVVSNVTINASAFVGVTVLSDYYARFVRSVELDRVSYRKLKQIHEHLVHAMPMGLIVTDLGRTITLVNHYAASLLGVEPASLERRGVLKSFASLKPILDNEEKIERGVNEVTHEVLRGQSYRLRWNISLLEDEGGTRLGYLILFEDITALYKLEKRAKRVEELAIIGRLAAGIVHEIRNPLASISGSIQVLSQLDTLPDDERNLIHIILREVDHLGQWTDEFLAYARPKEPECQDADVGEVLDDVVTLFRREKTDDGRQVTVETRFDVDVRAWIDPNQVRRAVRNVLMNARDAIVGEGRIMVTLERKAGHLQIRVADTGPGIPRDALDHVFEPFYTTKEGGTGLGLPIVQRIIEAHGGLVQISSTLGRGTVVDIGLPLSTSPLATGTFDREQVMA
jgi:two-component system sensor histidine kinase PilS (NtrC family)